MAKVIIETRPWLTDVQLNKGYKTDALTTQGLTGSCAARPRKDYELDNLKYVYKLLLDVLKRAGEELGAVVVAKLSFEYGKAVAAFKTIPTFLVGETQLPDGFVSYLLRLAQLHLFSFFRRVW